MLYICIPAYNEAETIGVLLWRIRKVFQEYSREYEILVYDDGSSDATVETLQPYGEVLPLTVLSGNQHRGYAAALDQLCRAVSARTRYPRRDAMITMGETLEEIELVMRDLRAVDVDILTLGQYLRPSESHIPIDRYVTPEEFRRMYEIGMAMGFKHVESGPLVRSSYHAWEQVQAAGVSGA